MPVLVNEFFEERLENLFKLAAMVEEAFSAAGIEYRVVGGLAVYLYVEDAEPDAGRLTKDIDVVVRRQDLERIAELSHSDCNTGASLGLTCWFRRALRQRDGAFISSLQARKYGPSTWNRLLRLRDRVSCAGSGSSHCRN